MAPDETTGSLLWGSVNALSALLIALLGPSLGAIADKGKKRKKWLLFFAYFCITATCFMWFILPNPSYTYLALLLVCLGIIGSEIAFIFYNAILPGIAPPKQLGKWSGLGWSCGYAGGVLSLIFAILFIHILPHSESFLNIRNLFLLAGIWFFLFSLPLLLFVPDPAENGMSLRNAAAAGLKELFGTLKKIKEYRILKFLIACMFYMDGLITIFAFGGVYAASIFHMNVLDILYLGLSLNFSAGMGAATLAHFDDRIGPKKLILISLVGIIIPAILLLFISSRKIFWILGVILGIFVGPVQSASRSYLARIAPESLRNEMFGFYALSGRATAFLCPILVGWITYLTKSPRLGMSTILVFLAIGFILILSVPPAPKR